MANKVSVADRFVQAKHDSWGNRQGPTLGFVLHMAEGFNVWRYLSSGNVLRAVSVHFTVEQDGEIVQMLGLGRISGSINPNTIRRDDDRNGYYGYSHNRSVMGPWWSNPNHSVITVEVAGYNRDGPNDAQVASIQKLFKFLKGKYPSIKPLGHRDFQNVKPCPGVKFFNRVYKEIGGHGKDYTGETGGTTGERDKMIKGPIRRKSSKYIYLPVGVKVYDSPGGEVVRKTTNAKKYDYFGYAGGGWWAIEIWVDGGPVIAYIEKQESYERGDWPVEAPEVPEAPDTDALEARIVELEDALREIRETSEGALVDFQISNIEVFNGE